VTGLVSTRLVADRRPEPSPSLVTDVLPNPDEAAEEMGGAHPRRRPFALLPGPRGVKVGDVLIALHQTTTPEVLRRLV